jgi:hypothetical protein
VLTSFIWLWLKSGVSSISGKEGDAGATFARFRGGLVAAVCSAEALAFVSLALMVVINGLSNLQCSFQRR